MGGAEVSSWVQPGPPMGCNRCVDPPLCAILRSSGYFSLRRCRFVVWGVCMALFLRFPTSWAEAWNALSMRLESTLPARTLRFYPNRPTYEGTILLSSSPLRIALQIPSEPGVQILFCEGDHLSSVFVSLDRGAPRAQWT